MAYVEINDRIDLYNCPLVYLETTFHFFVGASSSFDECFSHFSFLVFLDDFLFTFASFHSSSFSPLYYRRQACADQPDMQL